MDDKLGELLLLPNLLSQDLDPQVHLPLALNDAMERIDGLIAESEGGARRFLKRFKLKKAPHLIPVALLNEHSQAKDVDWLLEPVEAGECWGLVSDAGVPCLADPGSNLVYRARLKGLRVKAIPGPSSLVMALVLSGLPAQAFASHGYMPRDAGKRTEFLRNMEQRAIRDRGTQVFFEAPYRNMHAFDACLETLNPKTLLAIACDLTGESEWVQCLPVEMWRKAPRPQLEKRPAVFLVYAKN
ncbi:MAG: 16S rRNA methyltransferase [Waddliaceae bacterium]|nr:16S rRNA methyltransferase [Waddliaceae bacterium]